MVHTLQKVVVVFSAGNTQNNKSKLRYEAAQWCDG